jgi:hypothetical protein
MYRYLQSWWSRLKEIINLYRFIGLMKSINLGLLWVINFLHFNKNGIEKFDYRKKEYVLNWLFDKYEKLIPKKFEVVPDGNENVEKKIWVYWHQGYDDMPEVIKMCYKSVRQHSNGHKVILLSKDNIAEYVKIPNFIYEKQSKGIISLTHFSDILRINLLYNHGGLWLDSSLFITSPINTKSYNNVFYSIKNKPLIHGTISDYRWATFYLYSNKQSPALYVFKELFSRYWKENVFLIDYFLFDYFFEMLYVKNRKFKELIDITPLSNPNLHLMVDILNCPYDKDVFNTFIENTSVFKLTYRMKFMKTINNQKTLYGYIIDKYLNS